MADGKSRVGVDVALVILAIVVIGCAVWFGYMWGRQSVLDEMKESVEELGQSIEEAAPQGQAFEAEAARVTYAGKMETTPGNAMFSFMLENRTDRTVLVGGENVVVNGEFSVATLGGSPVPIAPGTKGSVSLVFGYTAQTDLGSMDDIKSVSCDLVMRDDDDLTTVVGTVPVSVAV